MASSSFYKEEGPKGVMNTQENPSRRQHHHTHTHTALSLVSSIDCAQHTTLKESPQHINPPCSNSSRREDPVCVGSFFGRPIILRTYNMGVSSFLFWNISAELVVTKNIVKQRFHLLRTEC